MFYLYLLIGVGVLLLLVSGARWYATRPPARVLSTAKWALLLTIAVALALAAVNGWLAALWLAVVTLLTTLNRIAGSRLIWLLLSASPLFPALQRAFRNARTGGATTARRKSDVETAGLRMSLDHDSGTMDGIVLQGRWRGRRLAELDAAALLDLLAEFRVEDPDSATLLEGYLDAVHAGWRQGPSGGDTPRPAAEGAMTREEAYRVLGLEPGAADAAIRAAYRELMKKVHPDQGGSAYLAAKLNQAKALLLGE